MNTKAIGWAPANSWFAPGFEKKELINKGEKLIYILPLPYYLASKFEAFNGRGAQDPRTSHDFEDIVYILDNRTDLLEVLEKTPSDVKPYLTEQLKKILGDGVMEEAVFGNLNFETRDERYDRIMKCIMKITSGD